MHHRSKHHLFITNAPALTRALSIGAFLLFSALWLWVNTAVGHAQGASPALFVNPDGGVAGNVVKLGGSGFAPGGYTGTILWDGVALGTLQIPTGGSFVIDFILPTAAAPGDHTITICRGSPCIIGPLTQQASRGVTVTAGAPQLTVKVAYVFTSDTAAAKSFNDLLTRHGMAVSLIPIDEIIKTDFRQFALTIVANDTGNQATWGTAAGQVAQIATNSKVLGIGEGGYAFFGQVENSSGKPGLAIGYPNGIHNSALAVYPVDPNLAFFRTAYNTGAAGGVALQIYTDNVPNVAISARVLGVNVLPTGYEDANGNFSTLVSEGCNHLWGFTADPAKMTANGRNLLINAVQQAMNMPCGVTLQSPCQEIFSPADVPAGGQITFDDLSEATVIENHYAPLYDVRFENAQTTRAIAYGKVPDLAASRPNVVLNEAISPATSALRLTFDEPKTHVGFWMGNGDPQQPPNGLLTAFDALGNLLCRAVNPVPEAHSEFIGLYDAYGRISTIQLEYNSDRNESIDDLYFAPNPQRWRIQLCQEMADLCPPAAGTVYRVNPATGGDPFSVDAQGFVLGAGDIQVGDQLWALSPMSATADTTIYRTSGAEVVVSAGAVSGGDPSGPGTLYLVAKAQQPLMVYNLDVSAQWYVQGDLTKADWLRTAIFKAASHFYDFTDGQVMLGKVTVYQREDNWENAALKLHTSNTFHPNAIIGGAVSNAVSEVISPTRTLTYEPGNILMGSYWNRYGAPPNQLIRVNGAIVPPESLLFDWSNALAHELGHYLLFLWDTYRDAQGQSSQAMADLCTGSAMGDAYNPSNFGFVYSPDHWAIACGGTEAYAMLNGRDEWETIQRWYPWMVKPTSFLAGPTSAPVALTTVTFVPPSTPPGAAATSQLFDLNYQGGENSSGEARGFIFRGSRIYEQGKPAKDTTQIQLIDAQVADRLCVYDINDHADGGETARHQFGCETIQLNDSLLEMTQNVPWQPYIGLTAVSTTSLSLQVTQTLPAGAQVIAKLYPEYGNALPEQVLTGSAGVYSHVFDLSGPVAPVYVQVWVDETPGGLSTRREVVADRGTGGSGAFGPLKALGGVLVVSSDGKANFESDLPLDLRPGESIAWQSMPGTPPLPVDRAIVGQSYRLDAFPASLVATGRISLEYEEAALLQAAGRLSVQATNPSVYFWDGASWQPLDTTLTTPVNAADGVKVATAPSQGVGVYAILLDLGQNQQFLPLIRR